jgi:hypothetical protein
VGVYSRKGSAINVHSQPGLNGDNVVASIILPSGVLKLKQVDADSSKAAGMNKDIVGNAFRLAMVDEDNPLVPGVDYVYATSKNFTDTYNAPTGMEGCYGPTPWAPRSESVQYLG